MVTEEKSAEKKALEKAEAPPPTPSGGERAPLFSMTGWIVVLGICIIEGLVFFLIAKMSEKREAKSDSGPQVELAYWRLDPPFLVTIARDGLFRSYEVKIALGMDKDVYGDEHKRKDVEAKVAKVRDTILTVMQNQPWPDVAEVTGQEKLKRDILVKVQALFEPGEVQEVCFESFSPK